jgi:hypothetical protein
VAYGGIALLGLVSLAREDNQALLVGQKPLNIEALSLFAEVPAAVVDDDTDPQSGLGTDTCLLQFGKTEPTTRANLAVVSYSLTTNGGAEVLEGAGTEKSSLRAACLSAA